MMSSPIADENASSVTSDEKLWAMLAHFAGLLGYVTALGQYIGPLVIYLVYKDKSKFVAFHALQSLFYQLGLLVCALIGAAIAFASCGVLAFAVVVVAGLGGVGAVVYLVIAAIKANNGEMFEYWLVGKWARQQVGI